MRRFDGRSEEEVAKSFEKAQKRVKQKKRQQNLQNLKNARLALLLIGILQILLTAHAYYQDPVLHIFLMKDIGLAGLLLLLYLLAFVSLYWPFRVAILVYSTAIIIDFLFGPSIFLGIIVLKLFFVAVFVTGHQAGRRFARRQELDEELLDNEVE